MVELFVACTFAWIPCCVACHDLFGNSRRRKRLPSANSGTANSACYCSPHRNCGQMEFLRFCLSSLLSLQGDLPQWWGPDSPLQFASSPSQAAERQRAPRKTFRPHRESQALAAGPVLRTKHRTVLRLRKENNIYFPAYFSCNSFQKDTNRLQKVLCPLSLATHAQCSFLFGHPNLGSRGQARIVRAANSCGQCPLSLTPAAAAQSGNLSLPSPVWHCYFRSLSQQHNAKRHIYSGVAFLLFILFFYFFYFI